MLVEPVIHLPSPEQKDRVQCEFLARKAFTLCWGGRAQKSSVARGDGHPQLSKKHSSELSVPEKGKKKKLCALQVLCKEELGLGGIWGKGPRWGLS